MTVKDNININISLIESLGIKIDIEKTSYRCGCPSSSCKLGNSCKEI